MNVFFSGGLTVIPVLLFLLAIGTFVFTVVRWIWQWNKNNHSPRRTVMATVVTKRTDVSCHYYVSGTGDVGHTSSSTNYYVAFQVEGGERIEFCVSRHEYGVLVEGDQGTLSFQGTRYLGFERR